MTCVQHGSAHGNVCIDFDTGDTESTADVGAVPESSQGIDSNGPTVIKPLKVKIQLTISGMDRRLFIFRVGSLTSTLLASKFDLTFIHAMNKYILHR